MAPEPITPSPVLLSPDTPAPESLVPRTPVDLSECPVSPAGCWVLLREIGPFEISSDNIDRPDISHRLFNLRRRHRRRHPGCETSCATRRGQEERQQDGSRYPGR